MNPPAFPPNFTNPEGSLIDELLHDIPLPRLVPIERTFARPAIEDAGAAFVEKIRASGGLANIRPGMSIAVAAGSRGITNLPLITRLLIDELKRVDAHPFIFPAMGSHGHATAEGQRAVLERMGFTEEKMGAPIHSSMEVVQIGTTSDGLPAYVDALAAAADGIVVINRIKPHTSFRGRVESGLTKMIVVGVGKQKGAEMCHNLGYARMEQHLCALGEVAIASGKFLFGVGVIENAYHETARIEIVPATAILAEEPQLLEAARELMPSLPVPNLDVLVIDEIGKNISGTGFDPNIVGRFPTNDVVLTERDPRITRIAVLDLTDTSHGNGTGLGNADFTTERVFRKFDFVETYANLLTSTVAQSGKIPMVMRDARQAVQAAIKTSLIRNLHNVRLARIKNTLELDLTLISENLVEEALRDSRNRLAGPAAEMRFDTPSAHQFQ